MAGVSSEMQRHAEPTMEPAKKKHEKISGKQKKKIQEKEIIERKMVCEFDCSVPGFRFWEEMEAMRNFGLTPEMAKDLQQLQKEASPELFTGKDGMRGKWHRMIMSDSLISEEADNELGKMAGLRSEMQQDVEEPLQMEAKAKKPKAKKKKMRRRREHVDDSIGSHQLGEMSYEGVTRQEAEKLYKKHMLRQDKLARKLYKEDRVCQCMLAGGRSLLDSQEQLANKNGKKNWKKAKAETKLKAEEARKTDTSMTEAGKPEASVTEVGRPVESVTEVEKSVTEGSKAAAKAMDGSNALLTAMVFEYADDFGAKFENFWNRLFSKYSAYDETTTIPAMCYTHGSDCDVITMDTLQVISVKVASIEADLQWPLQVFGMVSARDVLDRKRNIIFHRERDNFQTITEQDPYLTLTGPSRAVVVSTDCSYIEVVLKVKGATESEDRELSRLAVKYRVACYISGLYPCDRSTLELRFGLVADSIEATVHVKVTGGSWPDGFKGVFSAANARNEGVKVKLLDVSDDGLPVDAADGMIKLSRRVVSVEQRGMLKVFVSAGCDAGHEERCEASFKPAKAGVSSGVELKIGSCQMEVTVAWSLFCDDY